MKAITFHKKDIHRGSLVLINHLYPLVNRGIEGNMTLTSVCKHNPEILLECKTASILNHLFKLLRCEDNILLVSGYRSYEEQRKIYSESLMENGIEFTTKYVAYPGHSEHQTGLAIDLAIKGENIDFIKPNFPYDGICSLFREKALLHGFVERYQKGKEGITGIAHEPWHFRYVGYPHSVIMKQYNLVLEEYLELIREHPYEGEPFKFILGQQSIEIFYVKSTSEFTTIELPEDAIYQVSGDNIGGFILTLWE